MKNPKEYYSQFFYFLLVTTLSMCPVPTANWNYVYGGWYKVIRETLKFDDSITSCKEYGAQLAIIYRQSPMFSLVTKNIF